MARISGVPVLRYVDKNFLRVSGGVLAGVNGAHVIAYPQGATHSGTSDLVVPGSNVVTRVPVWHKGAFSNEATVSFISNTDPTAFLSVTLDHVGAPADDALYVKTAVSRTIKAGARLLCIPGQGGWFANPRGSGSASDYLVTDSSGRFGGYARYFVWDQVITTDPATAIDIVPDQVGGWIMRT